MLDSFSIDKLFVEIYEKQIFSSDFHPIRGYMFKLSFLTTLNIYKGCFKGHQRLRKCEAKLCSCKLWSETEFTLIHLSLESAIQCFYTYITNSLRKSYCSHMLTPQPNSSHQTSQFSSSKIVHDWDVPMLRRGK